MWVENESTRKDLLKKTSIEHNFANELLNFTDKQWQVTSKYHNLDNYNSRILLIKDNITIDTIKVEIDGSTLQNTDMEFFNFMHEILNNYEIGKYEFGNIKINIYNKKTLNNIICNNPKFNKNILIIE